MDNSKTVDHFRPISLRNVGYKIITKIIKKRPKPLLKNRSLDNQGAFALGKSIYDNILIAHEFFTSLNTKNRESGTDGS